MRKESDATWQGIKGIRYHLTNWHKPLSKGSKIPYTFGTAFDEGERRVIQPKETTKLQKNHSPSLNFPNQILNHTHQNPIQKWARKIGNPIHQHFLIELVHRCRGSDRLRYERDSYAEEDLGFRRSGRVISRMKNRIETSYRKVYGDKKWETNLKILSSIPSLPLSNKAFCHVWYVIISSGPLPCARMYNSTSVNGAEDTVRLYFVNSYVSNWDTR